MRSLAVLATICAACVGTVRAKLPDDVAAAVARDDMRRLETDTFVLYYPAHRHDEVLRFAARAEGCAAIERGHARLDNGFARRKPILILPDVPFNNAFVVPPALGDEDFSVVPLHATLDFATEFGLPPDPGYIACHELTHYTHELQIGGLWAAIDATFGEIISPQIGLDSWFWEGLATHYEAALQPHAGRPRWPIFTGMFAAAYAGGAGLDDGALSELNREPPPGGNYLTGTMFIDFLARRYGDEALWRVIEEQAGSWTIALDVSGRFKEVYGKSLATLFDDFRAEVATRFPRRAAPATQRRVREAGDDARYARGPDGTEAVIAADVDAPPHLDVFGPDGARRAHVSLVGVVPPRTLVLGDPLLASGLSITRDGAVYVTAIDLGATYQVTRLLRWRGDGLEEVATELGPGLCVSPDGATYYHAVVDGDRWSLGAYDLATGARRVVVTVAPGQYVLAAQPSRDGKTLVASVWDGRFSLWVIDAATGALVRTLHGDGDAPLYDASFTDDGRVVFLGEVAGRFQVEVAGLDRMSGPPTAISDAPYAALAPRAVGGAVRFLDREGWEWDVAEVQLPAALAAASAPEASASAPEAGAPAPSPAPSPAVAAAAPATRAPHVVSDEPYHAYDHLFVPTLHTIAFYSPVSSVTLAGVGLSGSDRLGWNRWALAGYLQPDTREGSGQVAYLNAMLAPWLVTANASITHWTEKDTLSDGSTARVHRQELDATLGVGRTWRGTWSASAQLVSSELHDRNDRILPIDLRLAGAGVAASYAGFESTPYAGARRGVALALAATYYPGRFTQPGADAITDLRGELDLALPVPGTRRHVLTLVGVGRDLRAASTPGLLELGGLASLGSLYQTSTNPSPPLYNGPDLPPLMRFSEVLRGYEDFPITTDRAAIASARWRYPVIVDHGWASSFYLFPATFVRQLDLELFAAGALDQTGGVTSQHAAVGGELALRVSLFRIPLVIAYQVARRVRDDDAWTQLVGVGPDL